ncbi:MAG: hypothetical protein RLY49_390 [Candidatus Parcubacteria bacterium]|jgi:hypothetical protein
MISELILKSFIDLFASGRSYAKVILFFAFFAYVGTLLFFKKTKEGVSKKYRNISFVILGIIFILGLSAHIYSVMQINVLPGNRILYLSETEISSSELLHIHELKGMFGMFDPSFHEGIDMGGASLNYVSPYVLWTSLILLILFLILYGLSIYHNEYKTTKNTLFWGLIFFILVKNAFDGGLLNYEVSALILFFLTYISFKKRRGYYMALSMIFIVFLGIFSFYVFKMLETYVFIFTVYILLFSKIKWIRRVLVSIVLLLVVLNAYPNISYINLKTENAPTYIASFIKNDSSNLLYTLGNMYIYQDSSNVSIKELLYKYKVFDNQRPISIEWKTCIPNVYKEYSFSVFSEQEPSRLSLNKNNMYKLSVENMKKNMYKVRLKTYACYSQRFENQVQEGLREVGLLPSIVYGVVDEQK